jgi:hypothetical protein
MPENHNNNYYSQGEVLFHVKAFLRFLLSKWWLILMAIAAGVALGAVYYYRQKPKFKAETTFILEEKSGGGSSLAGLASQFGISFGGMNGGTMFSGDNILNILTSKKVVQHVLLGKAGDPTYGNKTLADIYLEYTGIRKSWEKSARIQNFYFSDLKQLSPVQDSILNSIYLNLTKKDLQAERTSKQSSIIRVKATAGDCLFARLLTERIAEEASRLYMEVKTGSALNNIHMLQRRSDSLLYLLNRKSYTVASSQPLDFNPGIRAATVPVEIATRDRTVLSTLYAEVTKSLEMSRLMLSQESPVIQLLDRPPVLLDDNRKGLGFLVVVFAFVACILAFFALGAVYFLKESFGGK